MTVEQQMVKTHGSVKQALLDCIANNMNQKQIAEKFGCHRTFIAQQAKKNNVQIPVTADSLTRKNAKKVDTSMLGVSTVESRKGMTAAIHRGEEYFREVMLAEQVKVFKPGSPDFDAVAADIFRQRQLCQRVDPETVEKMI